MDQAGENGACEGGSAAAQVRGWRGLNYSEDLEDS